MGESIDDEIRALKARIKDLRKQQQRERKREYFQRPEVKEKKREYDRAYQQRPDVKLAMKLRRNGLSKDAIRAELSRLKEAAE